MKTVIANLWAEALISGDYPQGTKKLRALAGFCCLGVLCDLYRKETDKGEWIKPSQVYIGEEDYYKFALDKQIDKTCIPAAVQEWAGLEDCVGSLGAGNSLIQMNDSGSSFKEIAEIILSNIENL